MLLDYAESRRTNSERRDFWVYIGIMCGFGDCFFKNQCGLLVTLGCYPYNRGNSDVD